MDVGTIGRLSFNFTGTYTKDFSTQPLPTGGSYDCAAYWGSTCGRADAALAPCAELDLGHAVGWAST